MREMSWTFSTRCRVFTEKLAVVCAWDEDELLHLHLATAKAHLSITIQLRYKIRLIHNCSYFQ